MICRCWVSVSLFSCGWLWFRLELVAGGGEGEFRFLNRVMTEDVDERHASWRL